MEVLLQWNSLSYRLGASEDPIKTQDERGNLGYVVNLRFSIIREWGQLQWCQVGIGEPQ